MRDRLHRAAAAAWLWQLTGDTTYLDLSYSPVANLVRLSWLYEVDYGPAANARTFFGLMPTQRAAVITPKEQYEAWIYLSEYLRRAHGHLEPSVEKLVSEFCKHTLLTLPYAFPPLLPEGVASAHPAAYETVSRNRLDLHVPLEDLRDGWSQWGAIGQEVYGAGMAPTLAALAYVEVVPGVVVYSGYPLAEVEGTKVTFSSVPGTLTPVVVVGALLIATMPPLAGLGAFVDWLYRALVLLVIACPCALVISTPVTIVSGIARAARAGVLIKGGAYLEQAGALRVIAFDKTGTLTQGRPVVVAGHCGDHDDGASPQACANCRDLLAMAAAVGATARAVSTSRSTCRWARSSGRARANALWPTSCDRGSASCWREAVGVDAEMPTSRRRNARLPVSRRRRSRGRIAS